MDKALRSLFTSLILFLLLCACRPLAPGPSASPIPTLPPAQVDGGLPLRPDEDPLDIWRDQRLFRDTEVFLPEKAVNFPVLIVEQLRLDWEVLERFLRVNIPDGAFLNEEAGYFKDSDYPDKAAYGDRYSTYALRSDAYDTDWGEEFAAIHESVLSSSYFFSKRYEDPPLYGSKEAIDGEEEDFGVFPYTEQQAADLVLAALSDWGVPVEELKLVHVWEYGPASPIEVVRESQKCKNIFHAMNGSIYSECGRYVEDVALPYGGRGYTLYFRHMLYELPVYERLYGHYRDPSFEIPELDPWADDEAVERSGKLIESNLISFWGDSAQAIVTDFGLRSLSLYFHRVVDVEQHHVPIMPLSDVIGINIEAIREMGRVAHIELMLVPTYYQSEFEETCYRLVPAWCFFAGEMIDRHMIIDAIEGKTIDPLDDRWRLWPPQKE